MARIDGQSWALAIETPGKDSAKSPILLSHTSLREPVALWTFEGCAALIFALLQYSLAFCARGVSRWGGVAAGLLAGRASRIGSW